MPGTIPINLTDGAGRLVTTRIQTLAPGEIHVWWIDLARPELDENRLTDWLTNDECNRASRFHFIRDRRNFTIRRAVLRQLLTSYLGLGKELIKLSAGPHGKPFIRGQEQPDGIRFSCSHSASRALIAVTRGRELGVDLEMHCPSTDIDDLAATCFSDDEIKELAILPGALKSQGFFNGWTRKEAFVKALGLGLSFPLNRFSVSLALGKPATLLSVADDDLALKKWRMVALDAGPGYSAALVFENERACISYFEWNSL